MIVAFDNTFLCVLFGGNPGGRDPARRKRQIQHLVKTLSESKAQILIPTPALSELLMLPGVRLNETLERIADESAFHISPFDLKSAVELAQISTVEPGKGKRKGQAGTWAKVKFDRQIVAIAKANLAEEIYSTDAEVCALAKKNGIKAVSFDNLPDPPPEDRELFGEEEKPE